MTYPPRLTPLFDDTPEIEALRKAMRDFPRGTMVWHRASAEQGIVIGYHVSDQVLVRVSMGSGLGGDADWHPLATSKSRVVNDSGEDDGGEWKKEKV